MSEYKLKPGKIGKKVVNIYQKVEDTVVGAYKKVEDAFVDTFLEKVEDENASAGNGSLKDNDSRFPADTDRK